MLNFIIRLVLFIPFILVYVFFNKKIKNKILKNLIIILLIILIYQSLITEIVVPTENEIFKFETLSDCVDYFEISAKEKIKIDNNNYLIFSTSYKFDDGFYYYYKENNYWKNGGKLNEEYYNDTTINYLKTNDNELILFIFSDDSKINITDSINTQFHKNKILHENKKVFCFSKVINKIPNNYNLFVNDEKVELIY